MSKRHDAMRIYINTFKSHVSKIDNQHHCVEIIFMFCMLCHVTPEIRGWSPAEVGDVEGGVTDVRGRLLPTQASHKTNSVATLLCSSSAGSAIVHDKEGGILASNTAPYTIHTIRTAPNNYYYTAPYILHITRHTTYYTSPDILHTTQHHTYYTLHTTIQTFPVHITRHTTHYTAPCILHMHY